MSNESGLIAHPDFICGDDATDPFMLRTMAMGLDSRGHTGDGDRLRMAVAEIIRLRALEPIPETPLYFAALQGAYTAMRVASAIDAVAAEYDFEPVLKSLKPLITSPSTQHVEAEPVNETLETEHVDSDVEGKRAKSNYPEIPDGWVLVPREPTEAMIASGWIDKEDVSPDEIWVAMQSASPQVDIDRLAIAALETWPHNSAGPREMVNGLHFMRAALRAALASPKPSVDESGKAGIRICPERDGPCPHGMECPFNGDRYGCDMVGSRAARGTTPSVDEIGKGSE